MLFDRINHLTYQDNVFSYENSVEKKYNTSVYVVSYSFVHIEMLHPARALLRSRLWGRFKND